MNEKKIENFILKVHHRHPFSSFFGIDDRNVKNKGKFVRFPTIADERWNERGIPGFVFVVVVVVPFWFCSQWGSHPVFNFAWFSFGEKFIN